MASFKHFFAFFLGVSLVLLNGLVEGETVYLTTNVTSCANLTCNFEDGSIWSTGVVPSAGDVVYVYNTFFTTISIVVNGERTLASLFINSVTNFQINGMLTIVNDTSVVNSTVTLESYFSSGSFSATLSSDIIVGSNAGTFSVNGVSSEFLLDSTSSLQVLVNGRFSTTTNTSVFEGYVVVASGSEFASLSNSTTWFVTENSVIQQEITFHHAIFDVSKVYVFNAGLIAESVTLPYDCEINVSQHVLIEQSVIFTDNTASFVLLRVGTNGADPAANSSRIGGSVDAPAIIGGGLIYLFSSNLTILNNGGTQFNNSFGLSGQNQLVLYGGVNSFFNPQNLFFTYDGQIPPYTIFTVETLSIHGPLVIHGQIIVNENRLNIFGDVTVIGGVLPTSSEIVITNGELELYGTLILISNNEDTAYLTLSNATLTVGELILTNKTALRASGGNNIITGNVINSGTVHSTQNDLIHIWGSYTQNEHGIFFCDNLKDATFEAGSAYPKAVLVEGVTTLNGTISYSMSEPSNSRTYVVLQSNSNFTGRFQEQAREVSGSLHEGSVSTHYSHNTITLVYDHKAKSNVGKWVGIGIGIGVGVIIIVAIIYYVYRRNRRGYAQLTA